MESLTNRIMTYINRLFTEGTVSITIGGHSVIHSMLVVTAWRRLYHRWPALWQLVCIFLHDVGHFGKNYLTSVEEKNQHWELGAWIAYNLFGVKGFKFIAGHDAHSGFPHSDLYKPDKYAWLLAPVWWLLYNNFIEPKVRASMSGIDAVRDFKRKVRHNIESGEYRPSHDFYLERAHKEDRNA